MRPKGEVHLALIEAAKALATPERGATLRELAAQACVGMTAARYLVPYLARSGALAIVGTRRVPYRNRPVSEYAVPQASAPAAAPLGLELGSVLSAWGAGTAADAPADLAQWTGASVCDSVLTPSPRPVP